VFRILRPRRIVWTKDDLFISRHGTLVVVDSIPLSEIDEVMEMNDETIPNTKALTGSSSLTPAKSTNSNLGEINDTENLYGGKKFLVHAQLSNILQIKTALNGYNSGKTYYLSTRQDANPELTRQTIVSQLSAKVKISKRKADAKSRFEKSQEQVQVVQGSLSFQLAMALLIMVVILCCPKFS
jgi:hypothetical protein